MTEGNTERWRIVVKQAGGRGGDVACRLRNKRHVRALKEEADFLKLWRGKTDHVVRLIADAYEDVGQGTMAMDEAGKEVSRLYLEYCEGGEMTEWVKALNMIFPPAIPMPEEQIWHVFRCFSLALIALERGSEDLSTASWNREICHFDIKPQNVLLTTTSNTHPLTPVLKLADFGAAIEVPAVQDAEFVNAQTRRGTRGWYTPEQLDANQPAKRFGNSSNVWQIGKVMFFLICRGRVFDSNAQSFYVDFRAARGPLKTYGQLLLSAPYSILLRKTILKTLCYVPASRPAGHELLNICNSTIAGFAPVDAAGLASPEPPHIPVVLPILGAVASLPPMTGGMGRRSGKGDNTAHAITIDSTVISEGGIVMIGAIEGARVSTGNNFTEAISTNDDDSGGVVL